MKTTVHLTHRQMNNTILTWIEESLKGGDGKTVALLAYIFYFRGITNPYATFLYDIISIYYIYGLAQTHTQTHPPFNDDKTDDTMLYKSMLHIWRKFDLDRQMGVVDGEWYSHEVNERNSKHIISQFLPDGMRYFHNLLVIYNEIPQTDIPILLQSDVKLAISMRKNLQDKIDGVFDKLKHDYISEINEDIID